MEVWIPKQGCPNGLQPLPPLLAACPTTGQVPCGSICINPTTQCCKSNPLVGKCKSSTTDVCLVDGGTQCCRCPVIDNTDKGTVALSTTVGTRTALKNDVYKVRADRNKVSHSYNSAVAACALCYAWKVRMHIAAVLPVPSRAHMQPTTLSPTAGHCVCYPGGHVCKHRFPCKGTPGCAGLPTPSLQPGMHSAGCRCRCNGRPTPAPLTPLPLLTLHFPAALRNRSQSASARTTTRWSHSA